MAIIYEIVRQGIKNLSVAGHTAVQDLDVLMAGGCVSAVDIAYVVGFELRGLSGVQKAYFYRRSLLYLLLISSFLKN